MGPPNITGRNRILECVKWDVKRRFIFTPTPGPRQQEHLRLRFKRRGRRQERSQGAKDRASEGGRASDNQGVEKEPATRPAAPHADEWEARETTASPGEPPSLSHATPVVLFLLTIATTAAGVGKRCRLLAADATVVRPSKLR